MSCCSENRGSGSRTSWNSVWLVYRPSVRVRLANELEQRLARVQAERGVDRDPRGRQQPDVRAAQDPKVSMETLVGVVAARRGNRLGVLGDTQLVDGEGHAVQGGVGQEGDGAEGGEQRARDDEAEHQSGQGRGLEPGDGLASQQLVGGGGEGDEPQDRRDRGRGRCTLEQAGEPDDREADRERRDDHGHGAERRADEHHAAVADAVRQHPEDRREHELARVEQRPEDADLPRLHRLAAVAGQHGQVVDQHGAGHAGREPQREGAEDHREYGTRHARKRIG
jgi:hypothetical protein